MVLRHTTTLPRILLAAYTTYFALSLLRGRHTHLPAHSTLLLFGVHAFFVLFALHVVQAACEHTVSLACCVDTSTLPRILLGMLRRHPSPEPLNVLGRTRFPGFALRRYVHRPSP